jgi:hypothetical protein
MGLICSLYFPLIFSFSMRSVIYKKIVGDYFFPELIVLYVLFKHCYILHESLDDGLSGPEGRGFKFR